MTKIVVTCEAGRKHCEHKVDAYLDGDGIVRWCTNDAIPFTTDIRDCPVLNAMGYDFKKHEIARDADATKTIAAYVAMR